MLIIKEVSKTYTTGSLTQVALNKVSLNLRDNEFVAILGPSGSGKTTLLNIIGGLDRYDSGDLLINNVSTKDYKDRDWDAYRNHTIGFVFQSYNLIPHQTILSNVELALTIGGVNKKTRRQRALKALEDVGLADQAHKRPNQLSGGQMQRVAIARALVNNPDIVLADEPTGALDTKTSVQVMELLKEVAKDRLVVMVTHNPELANEYANRIINLKDGEITGDSNPYIVTEETKAKKKRFKKASMSIFTALSLSFNNLLTKKGRTILTAFAGSIGIIGIALILSLSQGFQNYIDKLQEDTLSSYPLAITSETADAASAILSMVSDHEDNKAEGENVIEHQYLTSVFSSIGTNDLKSFKKYLEDNMDEVNTCVSEIRYQYSISPQIYTVDATDKLVKLYPSDMWNTLYSDNSMSLITSMTGGSGIFTEVNDNFDGIKDQYQLLKGKWPEKYNEMLIVLSEPNAISDLLVYSLGLRDTDELRSIITNVMAGEEVDVEGNPMTLTYDDLLNIKLKLINAADTYKYNDKYNIYEDMSKDNKYMNNLYNNSVDLKIVGIVCPNEGSETMALAAGICYSKDLTQHVIDEAEKAEIVKKQIKNKDIDVFSNSPFDEINEEKEELNFADMITIDEDKMSEAFGMSSTSDENSDSSESAQEILDISLQTAKEIAEIDVSQLGTIFNVANKLVLVSAINDYEEANETSVGLGTYSLNLSNTDKFIKNIDGKYYQEHLAYYLETAELAMERISEIFPSIDSETISSITTLASVLDETFCDQLADGVKSLFEAYYKKVGKHTYTNYILKTWQSSKGIGLAIYTNPSLPVDTLLGSTVLLTLSTDEASKVSTSVAMQLGTLQTIATNIGLATSNIMASIFDGMGSFSFDKDKFAEAFKFEMDQNELQRIMTAMMSGSNEKTYKKNLINLGYQDLDDPTKISFYFKDFDSKEKFMTFLDNYNETLSEDDKLRYTDVTGLLMSSVKKIVDSVSYVLIAFVSISLVVSSIMIAVITLISVMERTKEIGILRAMGASKRNISSIFNAETFIIGLLSGLIGVGFTILAIPPINTLIHNLTDNYNINAVLPTKAAIGLIIISVVLTIFAGIIPSKKASKQDPVIALRTE